MAHYPTAHHSRSSDLGESGRLGAHPRLAAVAIATTIVVAVAVRADTTTVCPDGSCDFTDIQAAINASQHGDVIQIGAGSYSPIALGGKALELRGVDSSEVVIDGASMARVVDATNVSAGPVVLSHLTVRSGYVSATGSAGGAGIDCSGSTVLLEGVVIEGCTLERVSTGGYPELWGAGVYGAAASLTIRACVIRDNEINVHNTGSSYSGSYGFGGGVAVLSGSLVVEDSTIELNQVLCSTSGTSWHNIWAWGGGLFTRDSGVQLTNSIIRSNRCSASNPTSSVAACIARGGGLVCDGSGMTSMQGCTVSENRLDSASITSYNPMSYNSTWGGGVWLRVSSAVANCLFEENACAGGMVSPCLNAGGAIAVSAGIGATVHIAACEFRGNVAGVAGSSGERSGSAVFFESSPDSASVSECLVEAGESGGSVLRKWSGTALTVTLERVYACGAEPAIEGEWTILSDVHTTAACADCNGDGLIDFGQILDGSLADVNSNGVPDCCDQGGSCTPCSGDLTGDGLVNGVDLGILLAYWSMPEGDVTGDGTTDGNDLLVVLSAYGTSCR